MKTRQSVRWFFPIIAAGFLVACGDETNQSQDTQLPDRPDDKLIEETGQASEIDNDPTPQAGTSGSIPGYTPLADEDTDSQEQPTRTD